MVLPEPHQFRPGEALGLHLLKPELDGLVTVLLLGLDLGYEARPSLYYRYRHSFSFLVEYTRHAQFFANYPLHFRLLRLLD